MEQFNFENSHNNIELIETLVKEGLSYDLDLKDILAKIDSVKSMIKDGIIRIVLLGAFSDGKTSAIAGLLGRLEDTMKIDMDESSDELKVYRPAGLKKGFEIVDTPGLFGTKEKEVDGHNIKYSDITKKYLSEAHIVIYVCDAVTPLKDSHVPIIKWIMRDLGKLSSTVFVINKMDEAGYDLLDDEEYTKGSQIKKQNLITRLRSTMNLTPEEEKKLHIVCIAADPKGKGLAHWFTKSEDYLKRSHISLFRQELLKIVSNSNTSNLKLSALMASIKEMLLGVKREIDVENKPIETALVKVKDSCADLSTDIMQMKSELTLNRNDMKLQLDNYKAGLIGDIRGASLETIGEIADRSLGVQDGKITFYVFKSNIDQIMDGAHQVANNVVTAANVKFEREFNSQNEYLNNALKAGTKYLKNIKVSRDQVFAVRNVLFKNYKFKPWGGIKMAEKIMKGFGYFADVLNVAMEAYSWYKQYKSKKELDETKQQLINTLNDAFANIYASFKGDAYFDNFAPAYKKICEQLSEREKEIKSLQDKLTQLEAYKSKITSYFKDSAEEVEFEVV